MVRFSIDYDLMTVLARDMWHLRDEMDVSSKADHTFAAADISPRRETAEALTDFYGAWRKSFDQAWKVMTDLGNLLDEVGKAFYDQDASTSVGAAEQVAAFQRQTASSAQEAYKQRLDALRREEKAQDLQARYKTRRALLLKQQEAFQKKQQVLDKEQEAQQKKQEDLNRESDALSRQQEPLHRKADELQRKQQALWAQEKALRDGQESAFQQKQDALQKEQDALQKEQDPLLKRQQELQRQQQALWAQEKALREEQESAFPQKQDVLEREQRAYDAKADALRQRQEALSRERDALLGDDRTTQADLDAWQKKQDALWQEQDALWKEQGEPLQKKWEALQKEQQDQGKAFDPLEKRQQALDREREALDREQEPLTQRQEELEKRQQALRGEQQTLRDAQEKGLQDKQATLDREQDALRGEQEPLAKKWDDLQARQHALWQDQAANENAQDTLAKDQEPLLKQQADLDQTYAEQQDALRDYHYDPASGEGDPLMRRRGMDDELGDPPPPVPGGYTTETDDSSTTVSYKLDASGQVEVDRNGDPVETTTTVTDKTTGLVYSETHHALSDDGDSVTTIRSSDGSVRKVYLDVSPADGPAGSMERWVTDDSGDTLQIWSKDPDGDWVLRMDRDTYLASEAGQQDDQQFLDRPPAYLTVENPLLGADGRPAGDPPSQETTTTLADGNTRTEFTGADGSDLKVVTTPTARYVADANNEIQEIWLKRVDGTGWYLKDSITQHVRYGDEPPLGTLGENWR